MTISFLFAVRRRWPILVALPVLAAVLVFFLPQSEDAAPRFAASEIVAIDLGSNLLAVQQALLLIPQDEITTAAIERYGEVEGDPKNFSSRLRTNVVEESFTITFSATGTDPEEVPRYVGAFAEAYAEVENTRHLATFDDRIAAAEENLAQSRANLDAFLQANGPALGLPTPPSDLVLQRDILVAAVTEDAREVANLQSEKAAAVEPYRPLGVSDASRVGDARLTVPQSRLTRSFLAAVLAFVLAAVLGALVERFNPRMDDRDITEEVTGVPVLAMVPLVPRRLWPKYERVQVSEFSGPFAEGYRALRSHLDFLDRTIIDEDEGRGSVTAIVSAAPSEGKTVTVAYLALAYQEAGADVVVLGCDFRKPAIHERFGLSGEPGLTSRRDPTQRLSLTDVVQIDRDTGIAVVPSGAPTSHTTDLVPDARALAEAARNAGRRVVIDTAPVLVANDAIDLLAFVDHVVLVVRAGRTSRRSAREAMITLRLNEANVVGCVMIGSLEASEASGYYYGYYAAADGAAGSATGPSANGHGPQAAAASASDQTVDNLAD